MPTSESGQSQQQGQADHEISLAYSPAVDMHDDAYQSNGQMHPHWQKLLASLENLGIDNIKQRGIKLQRILRDDGATYKTYHQNQERIWGLDPVPQLIDTQSWQQTEAGLLQRTDIFNRLLKDIYGPQELIRHGVIAPESVFSHPGFIRPCFGMSAIAEQGLLLHGIDMVRQADNSVCIVGDRTQSPNGAGYALENRTVMSRVFPRLFRNSQVQRLASFFQTMRYQLNSLSSSNGLPNIVLLSPGSRSESYFEHAYLANYLGYSLVQGRDLTVRNGRVWTKSLGGLTQVDVILRRVDDFFCDPAELKSDSYLGVPGLLEVVRSGKVAVANPIGSGVLESPVFLKYLNDISQFFSGEDLFLPTAKTYWAYDPQDYEFIADNIHSLVIKPTFRSSKNASVIGSTLSSSEADEWREKIKLQPLKYTAQMFVSPSYAPSWGDDQFVSRPSVLRSFSVAGEGGYKVMPGGLTRIGSDATSPIYTDQFSPLSKDTWVLASQPERLISLRSKNNEGSVLDQEQLPNLPSRVVENMFWLGRYAVRAESALRLLRTVFVQLNDAQGLSEKAHHTILTAVTKVTETFPGFTHADSLLLVNPEAELISVILDAERAGSVMSSLTEMLECAEEVKALLSADTQRVINDIRDAVGALEHSLKYDFASAPEEALDPLVTSLLALSGLVHESMIRGYGWRFIEIGRNLERSYQTMSLLRALLVPIQSDFDEDIVLETVLLTLETLITYRRRYRAEGDLANGLALTMLDDSNPRSLHYLLQALQEHVDALPMAHKGPALTPERRAITAVLNKIQLVNLQELCTVKQSEHLAARSSSEVASGGVAKSDEKDQQKSIDSNSDNQDQQRISLDNVLNQGQDLLNEFARVLSDKYFDHMETHQQVQASNKWEDEL